MDTLSNTQLNNRRHRQHGAALLLAMVLIILAGTTAFLLLIDTKNHRLNQRNTAVKNLAMAKAALLSRAATDSNRPASLPCPDRDGDGVAELFLGNNCPTYLGRLPWKSLGMPEPTTRPQESLWYALSPNYRDHSTAEPVNPAITPPTLTLNNPGGPGTVVAAIFAPGETICDQNRTPDNFDSPNHYLELNNPIGGGDLQSRPLVASTQCESEHFNDTLLTVTPADLQPLIQRRFARIQFEAAAALKKYFENCGVLPWAMIFQDPTTVANFTSDNGVRKGLFPADSASPIDWGTGCAPQFIRLRQNAWYASQPGLLSVDPIYYAFGVDYQTGADGTCNFGTNCLVVNNLVSGTAATDVPALLIQAGSISAGQARPSPNLSAYFEYENANVVNDNFEIRTVAADFNDQVISFP